MRNHHFSTPHEITDAGKNHQRMLQPLRKRLWEDKILWSSLKYHPIDDLPILRERSACTKKTQVVNSSAKRADLAFLTNAHPCVVPPSVSQEEVFSIPYEVFFLDQFNLHLTKAWDLTFRAWEIQYLGYQGNDTTRKQLDTRDILQDKLV